jgi:hypothetical protein
VNEFDDPIQQTLYDYEAAVLAKDIDGFVALYDRDVLVFDMWRTWSYRGIAAWREMVAGWFGSLGAERVIGPLPSTSIQRRLFSGVDWHRIRRERQSTVSIVTG